MPKPQWLQARLIAHPALRIEKELAIRVWRQNRRMSRILLPLIALVFVAQPLLAQQPPQPPPPDSVVTTGQGVIQAVPDRAWITIGAESRASTAKEAQKKNTDAMTPVQQKLRSAGVGADAIRTIAYDVEYEWDFVNNRRVGRGYVARNTIEVRVDAVDRLGEYVEIAVQSGATNLGGIRWDLKDRDKLERDALRAAVAEARGKAEAAAAGAGRTIERIIRVEEHAGGAIPMETFARTMQAKAADAAPPISAGQIEIRASATVTAALR
jgi:uncharacterized protein